ncbi:LysR family transcriptional regulator [Actinobacillus capsulatus]|uniref:LysR family transcriptional regulator n=1 Tax=Actinobacillus capsulatus TaxID=717 RepID=UPI00039B2837|nr:LysR family transcriptional regulator [Actinobacillus capsulatus]
MDTIKAMLILSRVLETGNMSAVARELGMSSSAVSQHIRNLEQHYQMKLLNRTTRQISPTAAGQILWQGARQISQTLTNRPCRITDGICR